jgi:transmembrane sensor
MSRRDTPQAINDRATRWVARMDAAPLDAAAQAELDAWLARDSRHRGALFRATVAWRMLDRANALGAQRPPATHVNAEAISVIARAVATPEAGGIDPALPDRRRLLWAGGAIAASLIAGGIGLRTFVARSSTARIQTALGEIRHVPLDDGSNAVVNTATMLQVDFTRAQRNVRLETGEAWFEVAKDAHRAFLVAAGEVRVRAVGTAFSVHRVAGGAEVRVTEGTVEVWVAGREDGKRAVSAGARTFVTEIDGPQPPVQDAPGIDRKLAWRDGALKFEGDTLAAAAAEFNRYNRVKLEVDPALAAEKVVGRFRVDEPDTFAQAASTMFDAQVQRGREMIRIARQ